MEWWRTKLPVMRFEGPHRIPTVPVSGAMLHLPKGAKGVFKTLDGKCTEITENNCTVKLPDFTGYALVEVQELATHPKK